MARRTAGVCVGRGLNLATAHETALKLTELTGILVAPFSPADLMHGPVAAVGPDVPAVLVAPGGAGVVGIGARGAARRCAAAAPVLLVWARCRPTGGALRLALPEGAALPGWLTPLTAVVPGQLLAWRTAGLPRRRRRPARGPVQGDAHPLTGRLAILARCA